MKHIIQEQWGSNERPLKKKVQISIVVSYIFYKKSQHDFDEYRIQFLKIDYAIELKNPMCSSLS